MCQEDETIRIWGSLTEEERLRLVPRLLLMTRGWRAWSSDPASCVFWLARRFEEAHLPLVAEGTEIAEISVIGPVASR